MLANRYAGHYIDGKKRWSLILHTAERLAVWLAKEDVLI
jgi:hypothetical protein